MDAVKLAKILADHKQWLCDSAVGCRANLRSADLRSANLRSADLSSANLDVRIVSVSGVGSERRLTNYCIDMDTVWCGYFTGTLSEFISIVEQTHRDNATWLHQYRAAIKFFEACRDFHEGLQNNEKSTSN